MTKALKVLLYTIFVGLKTAFIKKHFYTYRRNNMDIKTKSSSEMERNNRVAMYAHLIEVVIMDIMILTQAFRRNSVSLPWI